MEEQVKIIKVPGTAITQIDRSFIVNRKDDKEFLFDVNTLHGISRPGVFFQEVSERDDIPWIIVEQ